MRKKTKNYLNYNIILSGLITKFKIKISNKNAITHIIKEVKKYIKYARFSFFLYDLQLIDLSYNNKESNPTDTNLNNAHGKTKNM